jgi:hypothetical protein
MEESVWLYFGVIVVIITIAIITSIFVHYRQDSDQQQFLQGLQQLQGQVDIVCDAPKDTMLSTSVTAPADTVLYTQKDKVCLRQGDLVRCLPTSCIMEEKILLNLTNVTLFSSHTYICRVLHGQNVTITCQG